MSSISLDHNIRLIDIKKNETSIKISKKKNTVSAKYINQKNPVVTLKSVRTTSMYQKFAPVIKDPSISSINRNRIDNNLISTNKNISLKVDNEQSHISPTFPVLTMPDSSDEDTELFRKADKPVFKFNTSSLRKSANKNKKNNFHAKRKDHFMTIHSRHSSKLHKSNHGLVKSHGDSSDNFLKLDELKAQSDNLHTLLKNIVKYQNDNKLYNDKYYSFDNGMGTTPIKNNINSSNQVPVKDASFEQNVMTIKKYYLNPKLNINKEKPLHPGMVLDKHIDKSKWNKLPDLNISPETWKFSHKLYNNFKGLQGTQELDKAFLIDYPSSILKIKGYIVNQPTKKDCLREFKLAFPKLKTRQLISAYAHQELLVPAYMKMLKSSPTFFNFPPQNQKMMYELIPTPKGLLKLRVTHTAKLKYADQNNDKKYVHFGLRASIILSTDKNPHIKYSYYFK
ncbi:MAG: hypothetical protein ACN793_00110 [Buchnera aphidicola (Eriosoma harunire)]